MKKKLLLFVVLSVMAAQVTFAQVDMSLFDKDQIWLFAGEKYGSEHCDGIVLSKDSLIYEYEDANYSKYSHQSKLPNYKQPKAVYDYNTLFFSTYKIDKKKYLFYFSRSGYAWKIVKLTQTDFIIERTSKCFSNDFDHWDNDSPKRFHFKREQKIKTACLPILESGDGRFSSEQLNEGITTYVGVFCLNRAYCLNPYPNYYPEKEK